MKTFSVRFLIGILLLSALALCSRAQLISNTTAIQLRGQSFIEYSRDTFGGSGVLASSGSPSTSFLSVDAYGATNPGLLAAWTIGSAGSASFGYQQVAARVNVRYADTITVTGSPDGTAGIFSARFFVSQTVDFSVSGTGTANTQGPYLTTIEMGNARQTFSLAVDTAASIPPLFESNFPEDSFVALNTPFIFGTPFSLNLQVMGEAQAAGGIASSTGAGSIDIRTALYWAGETRVTDVDGNDLKFSLSAESGLDYNRSFVPGAPGGMSPVPETTTYGLAAATALGAFVIRRRRATWIRR